MEKKGILVASFGTTYREAEKKCIQPIAAVIKRIFTDYETRLAYTSTTVINKLAKRGQNMLSPVRALQEMAAEGFTHVIVQPLLFISGHEYYEKIIKPLAAFKDHFKGLIIGQPLLSSQSDYDEVCQLTGQLSRSVDQEKIIFMGHGSDHPSDQVYQTVQQCFNRQGINAEIATVEGAIQLADILKRLEKEKTKQVHLFPLMLVAGDHATNDMAGEDEESWKNQLEKKGIQVTVHLKGLGEFMRIRRIFIRHIRKCKKELFPQKYEQMKKTAQKNKPALAREKTAWFPGLDSSLCNGCGNCFIFCHRDVYQFDEISQKGSVINPYQCVINCSHCSGLCPAKAISFPENKIDLKSGSFASGSLVQS